MIFASIIIPAHERTVWISSLIQSLHLELGARTDVEVIVVDDGSREAIGARHLGGDLRVSLFRLEESVGPAAARNFGVTQAQGELLLFLDDDGEVAPGWLQAMLDAHEADTILLGNVVDFEGDRVQSVPRCATFLGKSLACRPDQANTGPSCNLGVPRACFEALGGFDEEIPYYFEDSDLCIRARRAGFAFRFVEGAVFRHHGSEVKTGEAVYMQEHNSTYAMLKVYTASPSRRALFALANGLWMALRLVTWTLAGRPADAQRLFRGWRTAHIRFARRRTNTDR